MDIGLNIFRNMFHHADAINVKILINIIDKLFRRYLEALWCDAAYTEMKNTDWDNIDMDEYIPPWEANG